MSRRKIVRREGDIVRVPLKDGRYSFARVLPGALFAFYSGVDRSQNAPPPADIVKRPIAFIINVMAHAITEGRWVTVTNIPLADAMRRSPEFFKQDPLTGRLEKTRTGGGDEVPATREECRSLERAAVWEPEHVEERILDEFEGRTNRWVEQLRLK